MKVTGVRVEISKTISDGHYGNERFNAQYIAELDDGEDPDEAIRTLSERGRREIIGQLAESESASIRYAIAPPKHVNPDICPSCGEHHDNGEGNLCDDCKDVGDEAAVESADVPF